MPENNYDNIATKRQQVYDYVYAMLGGNMVDVELDPIHYETALNKALNRFRQRSPNSVEESYVDLELIEDQNDYILPPEVIEVRQIFRRGVGSRLGGTGQSFEPFQQNFMNTYMLQAGGQGGLLTYELFAQRQELLARMFGGYIEFKWNTVTKRLTIFNRPRTEEGVLLWCYNYRPDFQLIDDYLAGQWLRDYTLATCKYMLGEARSKFSVIAGPQGGGSLNGDQLKAEAQQEIEKLDLEVSTSVSGGPGLTFLIG